MSGKTDSQKRRRVWHYCPTPNFRSKDAGAWCADLEQHLQLWIGDALAGDKQHRLSATSSRMIARSADEIHCDIAQALAAAVEWDGFSLAHELKLRGWPADVELVVLCNRWSCALRQKIRARLAHRGPNFTRGET